MAAVFKMCIEQSVSNITMSVPQISCVLGSFKSETKKYLFDLVLLQNTLAYALYISRVLANYFRFFPASSVVNKLH